MESLILNPQIDFTAPVIPVAALGLVTIAAGTVVAFGFGRRADGALRHGGNDLRLRLLHHFGGSILRRNGVGERQGNRRGDLHGLTFPVKTTLLWSVSHVSREESFNHLPVKLILAKCRPNLPRLLGSDKGAAFSEQNQ